MQGAPEGRHKRLVDPATRRKDEFPANYPRNRGDEISPRVAFWGDYPALDWSDSKGVNPSPTGRRSDHDLGGFQRLTRRGRFYGPAYGWLSTIRQAPALLLQSLYGGYRYDLTSSSPPQATPSQKGLVRLHDAGYRRGFTRGGVLGALNWRKTPDWRLLCAVVLALTFVPIEVCWGALQNDPSGVWEGSRAYSPARDCLPMGHKSSIISLIHKVSVDEASVNPEPSGVTVYGQPLFLASG